ncbi:MAG: hypothetical protein WCE38_06545, partial [Burkholderiales bacterium]
SYAARTGRPQNVGVIGVAVFREHRPPRPAAVTRPSESTESRARDDAQGEREAGAAGNSAPSPATPPSAEASADMAKRAAPYAQREEKLGTGHGERETSVVRYTSFQRASEQPNQTITIQYDSYRNLVARGIIPSVPRVGTPNPFPNGGFVPDPRG